MAGNEMIRAGCWAHLRRKVIEAEKAAPEIARQAMERVGALYGVERQAAGLSTAERLKLRQEKSAPMLLELRDKLLVWREQLLPKHPKHPMAEAIGYALSQWRELSVFCSDGAVAIDNKRAGDEACCPESKKLAVRGKSTRWEDGGHLGQPYQHLPPS